MDEDQLLAAQLAAQATGYMRTILRGGTNDAHNIVRDNNNTNWRNIIANRTRGQQQPQQRESFQPDTNFPGADGGYGDLPSEVPATYGQIPMPRDAKGNIIIPPELQQQNQPQSSGLDIGGFKIPTYGAASATAKNEQFEQIMKEIKLLKRSVSMLTNLLKKSILANNPELLESSASTKEKNPELEKEEIVKVTPPLPNFSISSETTI